MKMIKTFVAASLVLTVGACKKDNNEGGGGGESSAKVGGGGGGGGGGAKLAGNFPAEFQAWDLPARKAAWQGAWAGEGGALGNKAAWQIAGDKVTYVDGRGEKQLGFELESPCSAKLVEKGADGSSSSTISTFTLQGGKLVTGLGDAGSRKGDTAVVCGGGDVFTFDGKACKKWDSMFDKWTSEAGECGFRKDGDKEVFFYKGMGSESVLIVDGDVIWSEQMRDRHAASHPDLAAAKTAQGL